MSGCDDREIYIIITQTGTILSKICGLVTGARYNHASISLDEQLDQMYSFGRRHPYNPFWGGFVRESPTFGTFLRFRDTQAVVMRLRVSEKEYERLERRIRRMEKRKTLYHYNTLGLMFAAFNKKYRRANHYYCSEFVWSALETAGVEDLQGMDDVVQPMHLMNLDQCEEIYRGKLRNYPKAQKC